MEREFVEEIVGDEMESRKDLKMMSHLTKGSINFKKIIMKSCIPKRSSEWLKCWSNLDWLFTWSNTQEDLFLFLFFITPKRIQRCYKFKIFQKGLSLHIYIHHHHRPVPTMLGSYTWIPFLHSNLFWAKSLDRLHFFKFILTTPIHVFFGLLFFHGEPSTCIENSSSKVPLLDHIGLVQTFSSKSLLISPLDATPKSSQKY